MTRCGTVILPEHIVLNHIFLQHLVQSSFGPFGAAALLFTQHLKELAIVLLLQLTFRLHREVELHVSVTQTEVNAQKYYTTELS